MKKRVVVRLTLEYEIEVAEDATRESIEFARNEGSWCASNLLEEIQALDKKHGCLCSLEPYFEYVHDVGSLSLSGCDIPFHDGRERPVQ